MKTNHIFIQFFVFLFGIGYVNAEESRDSIDVSQMCCVYQHKTRTLDLNKKIVDHSAFAILEVGENIAKYGDFFAYQGQRPDGYSVEYMDGDPRGNDGVTVYQNFSHNGQLVIREGLLPHFYIYEEQPAMGWKLVSGQENILGYKCKKAIAEYAGRTWSAYYAEDIPSANGPWKLTGLPGLILKAESEDGVHCFVAQCLFKVSSQKISFDSEKTDIKVRRNKFIALRNRLKTDERWAKNAGYYINTTEIKSLSIIRERNDYALAPAMIVNDISLPIGGGFEFLFQPLELK